MLFKRYYDDKLAQASYLIACEATGDAIVVDPNRDIAHYVREAKREGVRIAHVTETHIHADYLSGSRELAQVTGARLWLSDEGGDDWRYRFVRESSAWLLHDEDEIALGKIRIRALHTPGHTPEHLVFLITDLAVSPQPLGLLSGDLVFVGDVGRPDLLEKAARIAGTMDGAARTLYHSLQRLKSLPDHIQIWPGHGAGSACGKALGSMPQSTLGFERISSWAFAEQSEEEFVAEVLTGQPSPPLYFAEMKRLNRDGPPILGGIKEPRRINLDEIAKLLSDGCDVIDTRRVSEFAARHIPGTINVPLGKSFTTRVGSVLSYEKDFGLIVARSSDDVAAGVARDLALIGLDRIHGMASPEVLDSWEAAGKGIQSLRRKSVVDAADLIRRGEVNILDVRDDSEIRDGHLPGMIWIPLTRLAERFAEVPTDKPVLVYCRTGSRSVLAASLLAARGVAEVEDIEGGITKWQAAGLPVVHPEPIEAVAG